MIDLHAARAQPDATFRDVLVHLDSGGRAAERLALAAGVARLHGARLTGLFAERGVLGQSLVGRRDHEGLARAAQRARAAFDAAARAAGVASRWWEVEAGEYADVVHAVVVCCRYADLAVFGQQRGDDAPVPEGLVERVVAEAGTPALVVPSVGSYPATAEHVLVAWTGSREAARALRDALPLLERAARVTVLSLQLPNAATEGGLPPVDVVDHLRAHDVDASYERAIVGELPPVDLVLSRAADVGADLIVMGAYGAGSGLLGRSGTTRAMLETMTRPVLLST